MNLALIVAIISPFIFALGNIFDKYVMSRKVKDTFAYTAVAGIVILLLGIIIAFFLSWDNINLYSFLFPILAGIVYGSTYYFYFYIMKNSDVTYVIGFLFLFPIVVTVLSFIFLGERLSYLSYLAIALILVGVILLSSRARKIKMKVLVVPLVLWALLIGGYEFFVKATTNNITFMQGLAITTIAAGFTVLCGLLTKKVRQNFLDEIKNIKWAFISEFIGLVGVLTIYFAMSKLQATFVAAIAATQPLVVLILEKIVHSYAGNIAQDVKLLPKLGAIILIVLGVVLLTIFGTA